MGTTRNEGGLVMTKFCILCEVEIDDDAIICNNCGEPQMLEEIMQNHSIPVSKTSNQENGNEIIIRKENGGWVESALLVHTGKVVLTSRRIIYYNFSFLKARALGLLILLSEGDYKFEILLKIS